MSLRSDLPPDLPGDDDVLAAELAMGLLAGDDKRAAEARAGADPAFRAAVAAWQERLVPLAEALPGAEPPTGALAAIERRLGWEDPARPRRSGLARILAGFEFILGAAAAAILVAWLAVIVAPVGPQPVLVATIAAESGELRFEARHDPVTGTLSVVRVAGEPAPEGRAHEVWVIAPDAAPVSLGLVDEGPLAVAYPAPPAGWVMAVSLEPTGGSPTGAPTGPVLALGEVTDV